VERLAGLEEFQEQREELVSNMESLEKQLACQKERHKDEIHSLEMKVLLEKRRLRDHILHLLYRITSNNKASVWCY